MPLICPLSPESPLAYRSFRGFQSSCRMISGSIKRYAGTAARSHVGTKQAPLIGHCGQIVDLPESGKFCYNEDTRHRTSALGPDALCLRWYAALSVPAAGAKRRSGQVRSCREHLAPERCGLTARSSGRVMHQVPSSCASARAAQLVR